MPACSKPNNDIVTDPREPAAGAIIARQFPASPGLTTSSKKAVAPAVPTVDVASVKSSAEARRGIDALERLGSRKGVDAAKVKRELVRLRSRLAELEQAEQALNRLDALFVTVPAPIVDVPDPIDTVELASWAMGATRSEIGALAERAAARWAEQYLGMRSDTESHHVNAHGIDHVLVDPAGNLFLAETKGTAGIGRTEQARYARNNAPGPRTLLSKGQFSDSWIERDAWMREQDITADAVAEKLFFRVDITSQTIDVFGQDENGMLTQRLGCFHCETIDLITAMRDSGGSTADA